MSRGAILLLVLVGAGIAAWILWPSKGGETADAIADRIGREVPCPTVRENVGASSAARVPLEPLFGADETIEVTCDGGYVNPLSTLVRFESHQQLAEVLSHGGGKLEHVPLCVLDDEFFTPSLGGKDAFEDVCAQLGGQLTKS